MLLCIAPPWQWTSMLMNEKPYSSKPALYGLKYVTLMPQRLLARNQTEMNIDHAILFEIFKDLSFSKSEESFILSRLEKQSLNKGDVLLKASEKVMNQYYVHRGCLRTFFIDASGKEHTLQFAIHNWLWIYIIWEWSG